MKGGGDGGEGVRGRREGSEAEQGRGVKERREGEKEGRKRRRGGLLLCSTRLNSSCPLLPCTCVYNHTHSQGS